MSILHVSQIPQLVEKCKIAPSVHRGLSEWLERQAQDFAFSPLLWLGAGEREAPLLAQEFHRAAHRLLARQGSLHTVHATQLYKDLQTYGEHPLDQWKHHTLYLTHLHELPPAKQIQLLQTLQSTKFLRKQKLLLLFDLPNMPEPGPLFDLLTEICPIPLTIPSLHHRHGDIDRLLCQFAQTILQQLSSTAIEGFSLEATAHIHRAVLQTERNSDELYSFLHTTLTRAHDGRLPLHNGYIVTWPTVRLLEDLWGYRLNQQNEFYQDMVECDFQERLMSASIEHAACRSGLSKELIELQCRLLHDMIEELPPHQRSYQGLTSRLDQLLWIGMKLYSNARTQAELRDFFGFEGKGKIPKATAKLKFDQYNLEHFGFRSMDPLPWQTESSAPPTPVPIAPAPVAPVASAPPPAVTPASERQIVQVEGELAETLFWRHQDLFTVLSGDSLSASQLAQLMQFPHDRVQADLEELVEYGFLQRKGELYTLDGDDVYYRHTHSRIRCLEENLLRYLDAAFQSQELSILDNWFLRLPDAGLPQLRETLLRPFIHEQFLPLSDTTPTPTDAPYNKRMYALLLLGTHRLSPNIHGRLPLEERILYYFREASLQRADQKQQHQAICLRATQMLSLEHVKEATQHVQQLRKHLRNYLPHGRGNKPNFNLTLCFTEVPLAFYRDLKPIPYEERQPHHSFCTPAITTSAINKAKKN